MKINLFKCKINVSFPLIAILTLSTILDRSGVTVLGFFATVLHELGHLLAMKLKHYEIKEVNLNLFNFNIIDYSRNEKNFSDDIFILLSGPIFNLFIAILSIVNFNFFPEKKIFYFFLENILIAIVNIVPIMSLDGGQIFYIFWTLKTNEKAAYHILNIISVILLIPMFLLGFFILIKSKYNFSLLWICLYLVTLILFRNNEYI